MKAKNTANQSLVNNFQKLSIFFATDPKAAFKLKALKKVIPQIVSHELPIVSGNYAKKNLSGVGKGFAERIDEILETGTLKELVEEDDDETIAIQQLSRVTGIGPVYAKKLYEEDEISTIEELQDAVSRGIVELSHHRAIGLKYLEEFEKRIPSKEVKKAESILLKELNKIDKKLILTICGSYRRGCPSCGDIDVLITHPDAKSEETYLAQLVDKLEKIGFLIDHLTESGNKKYMGVCRVTSFARRIDIRFVDYSSYYAAMLYFTGSKHFNIGIRNRALEMGYSLNEYGLHKSDDTSKKIIPVNSEEEIFDILGIDYVPPTNRDIGQK
jgi:DNA polymerase beta